MAFRVGDRWEVALGSLHNMVPKRDWRPGSFRSLRDAPELSTFGCLVSIASSGLTTT